MHSLTSAWRTGEERPTFVVLCKKKFDQIRSLFSDSSSDGDGVSRFNSVQTAKLTHNISIKKNQKARYKLRNEL